MRVSLFSTAVLMLTLIAAGGTAQACDCMTPPEPEMFKKSAVVFEGEVIFIAENRGDGEAPLGYVFRVNKTLKGEPVPEITIFGGFSNCDAEFNFGGVYRVYASEYKGKLRSSSCSGNKLLYQNKILLLPAQASTNSVWQLWYVKALAVLSITVVLTLMLRYVATRVFPAKS